MNHLIEESDSTKIIKAINAHRLANKGQWIFVEIRQGDSVILVKSFNTSIQVIRRDGISYPCSMDLSVKEWKSQIERALVK